MPRYNHVQQDFSGGEIGLEAHMRGDLPQRDKSVLRMINFIPRLGGSALRAPGTQFVGLAQSRDSRLIPYITFDNRRVLLEVYSGGVEWHEDFVVDDGGTLRARVQATAEDDIQLVKNNNFGDGFNNWQITPSGTMTLIGNITGWSWQSEINTALLQLRWPDRTAADRFNNTTDYRVGSMRQVVTIPENTDFLRVSARVGYLWNYDSQARYIFRVRVYDPTNDNTLTDLEFNGGVDVNWTTGIRTLTEVTDTPGTFKRLDRQVPGSFLKDQEVGIEVYAEAVYDIEGKEGRATYPHFQVNWLQLWYRGTVTTGEGTVTGTVPDYTPEELNEIQFTQSPYQTSMARMFPGPNDNGNELVLVHPNYRPQHVFFNGADTIFQEIPFAYETRNEDGDRVGDPVNRVPPEWQPGSYPAAVTNYLGRCVFAGGSNDIIGSPSQGAASQTVWSTQVGNWQIFTDTDTSATSLPDDSVIFTTTYRSPLQWALGQRWLLLGAESVEYVANSDGIYSPGDLGVHMHSTHGSARVQPVNMGQWCLFAADGGTKLRAMTYNAENESWVALDLGLLHTNLFQSGIRRMVRLRAPHQIAVILANDGRIRLLHIDTNEGLYGWSEIDVNGHVHDIAVITTIEGDDILCMTVERYINGGFVTFIEIVTNWDDPGDWFYMNSSVQVLIPDTGPTNVLTGLIYLEGERVHVTADGNYLGVWEVVNAEIELIDDIGMPINVQASARVGLAAPCNLSTLPLLTDAPDAKKKYKQIVVRTLGSSRPMINGERPRDRDPQSRQSESQRLDLVRDNKVTAQGSDPVQLVVITEDVPYRLEVLGVFGTVEVHEV